MPTCPVTSTSISSPLACHRALTLLRSMGDGEWASVTELSGTTGLSSSNVRAGLVDLEANDFVKQSDGRYQINCHTVRQALAKAATEFVEISSAIS